MIALQIPPDVPNRPDSTRLLPQSSNLLLWSNSRVRTIVQSTADAMFADERHGNVRDGYLFALEVTGPDRTSVIDIRGNLAGGIRDPRTSTLIDLLMRLAVEAGAKPDFRGATIDADIHVRTS